MSIERYLLFTKFMIDTIFLIYMSNRIFYSIAGPCFVGHETERGKVFPENGKFLVICLSACHLGNIRVPLLARMPRVGIPAIGLFFHVYIAL